MRGLKKKKSLQYITSLLQKYPHAFYIKVMGASVIEITRPARSKLYPDAARSFIANKVANDVSLIRDLASITEAEMAQIECNALVEIKELEVIASERARFEKERKENKYREILDRYPHGVERYKSQNQTLNTEIILRNESIIEEFEAQHRILSYYKRFEEKQNSHAEVFCDRIKTRLPEWSCTLYIISIPTRPPVFELIHCKIPHSYACPVCFDETCEFVQDIKLRSSVIVPMLQDCRIEIKHEYYDAVLEQIKSVPDSYVYLVQNGFEVDQGKFLDFHFAYLKSRLRESKILFCEDESEIPLCALPNLFIVEVLSREDLFGNLVFLSQTLKQITYISIIQEVSSEEMKKHVVNSNDRAHNQIIEYFDAAQELEEELPPSFLFPQESLDISERKRFLEIIRDSPNAFLEYIRLHPDYTKRAIFKRERLLVDREEMLARVRRMVSQEGDFRYFKLLRFYKSDADDIMKYLLDNGVSCFYHFTDKDNIDSIRKYGGLFSWWFCKNNGIVIPKAGGDSTSRSLDVKHRLENYVRLSFCDDHPLSFRRQQEGATLAILKISTEVAIFRDTLFSNINATDSLHTHGPALEDLKRVDMAAVKQRFVPKDSPFFKMHQAEILVKTFIPLEYILNIDNPVLMTRGIEACESLICE